MSGCPCGCPAGARSQKSVAYISDSSPEKETPNQPSQSCSPSASRRSIPPLSDTELPANLLDAVFPTPSKEAYAKSKPLKLPKSVSKGNVFPHYLTFFQSLYYRADQCP